MSETIATEPVRRKYEGRSPNYPYFDLERSLARAAALFQAERMHWTPVEAALHQWGYTNPGGKAAMTLSSMKQFGLIEDQGRGEARRVRVTTRAHDILNTPHAEERSALLRQAALAPEIHREMWNAFGNALPSDDSLVWTLSKEHGFTRAGAEDFVRQWKRTMQYAGIDTGAHPDIEPDLDADTPSSSTSWQPSASEQRDAPATLDRVEEATRHHASDTIRLGGIARHASSPQQQVQIPLPGGTRSVTLSGDFPLREPDWDYLVAVMNAMKPGLVAGAVETSP